MIVITGAAGFIGSNFVHEFSVCRRTPVAICDTFGTEEKWRNLASSTFHTLVAPSELLAWLRNRSDISAVVHMGAISATTARDGDAVMMSNFRLSVDLLDHCTTFDVPFCYASSASIYGAGEQGFVDDMSPDAIAAYRPLNLYGWSKRQFDFVVADRLAHKMPMPPACIGLRFFNVFGPNEYHKGDMRSIVAKMAESIVKGERVKLFKSHRVDVADGDQRRDFIYVKDAVTMSLALIDARVSGIFNIGTGHARSFREIAELVFRNFEIRTTIDYVDMPQAIRANYQYFTEASCDTLRQIGCATPCLALEDSVEDYVRSYLRDGYYR